MCIGRAHESRFSFSLGVCESLGVLAARAGQIDCNVAKEKSKNTENDGINGNADRFCRIYPSAPKPTTLKT